MAELQYTAPIIQALEAYAGDAYNHAEAYLSQLNSFVTQDINMGIIPSVSVDVPTSITIDPAISGNIPLEPTNWPSDSAVYTIPSITDHDMPDKPTFTFPDVPTLTDIVIPEYVEGTITSITTTMPTMGFDVPTVGDISTTNAPLDSLFQTIQARLESMILNGGTLLDPTVEADIWNRDRERREQALQDAVDKVTSQWSKFNWTLPDGLLAGAIAPVNVEYLHADLERSRDISIKQAELEQQGLFKAIESGISIENIVMTSQNEYAKRVLEAAKVTADVTIEIFKQRVVQYNSLLEAFKADVEVYKASIQAELSRAEVYKARIQGLQTVAAIDENRVKIYVSRISAIEQLVNLYNSQIKAVATQYEAEKTKIDAYKVRVEAYVAQIEGITKKYMSQIEGYKAYVTAYSASSDTQTKLADLKVKGEIASLQAAIQEWEIQLKLIQEGINVKLEALKTVATVSSNLAAGALSAIHASVSDAFSYNYSQSFSHSEEL